MDDFGAQPPIPATDEQFLQRSVRLDPLAIQEEYVELPATLSYWNGQYANALRAHLRAKLNFERIEARLKIEHREAMEGKVTDARVEAAVLQDPAYEAARLEAIEAEVEKVRTAGIAEAVRAKKDMLISLGATLRAELEGDPSLRGAARANRFAAGG